MVYPVVSSLAHQAESLVVLLQVQLVLKMVEELTGMQCELHHKTLSASLNVDESIGGAHASQDRPGSPQFARLDSAPEHAMSSCEQKGDVGADLTEHCLHARTTASIMSKSVSDI